MMNNVLTELLASQIPVLAYPFVYTLCMGEGGTDADAWRREYGGGLYAGSLDAVFNAANPLWDGRLGPTGLPTHALGAGQFQPGTYGEVSARTGLPTLAPQSQLANIWNHAQFVFIRLTGLPLLATLTMGDWGDAGKVLAPTWTSLGLDKYPSRYAVAVKILMGTGPVTTPPPMPVDPEIVAIGDMLRDLAPLDVDARKRVIAYVSARLMV
jgi:hypothetical protein